MSAPVDPRRLERIKWRARRGLLENDILLGRFLDKSLAELQNDELSALEALLQWDDNDLLDVLMGRKPCGDEKLNVLVQRIRIA
jgi:succinate dehydrogenase flavin-adding protein (antitoxin of CptAB toxin-antitoxin module)